MQPLLTPKDAAALVGCAKSTVLRWIREGDLPVIELAYSGPGKRRVLRIRPEALDDFLNSRSVGGRPAHRIDAPDEPLEVEA